MKIKLVKPWNSNEAGAELDVMNGVGELLIARGIAEVIIETADQPVFDDSPAGVTGAVNTEQPTVGRRRRIN